MTSFYILITVVLCSLGIAYIIEILCDFMLLKKSSRHSVIIPISGEMEDIEYIIRRTQYRYSKIHEKLKTIIILDIGASKETLEICRQMSEVMENIRICSLSELKDFVRENE